MSEALGDLTLLRDLNRLLIRATDLPGVMDAALDMLLSLGVKNAAAYIYEPEQEALLLVGERNHPPSVVAEWQRVSLSEETMVSRAVRTGQVQVETDLLAAADELPKAATSARLTGFRAAMALPLIASGRPVGGLACGFLKPLDPDDPLHDLLQAVAQTIAIAVLHTRLTEATRQREADQALLAEAARLFNSAVDLPTVFHDVAEIVATAIGDGCMILLLEPGNPELTVAGSYHRDRTVEVTRLQSVAALPPRIDRGAVGQVIQTQEPLVIRDPSTHPGWPPERQTIPPTTSWVGAPIVYRGEPLGVLAASSTTPGVRFGDRERRLAASLADSAAPAIANARLIRQISSERAFLESVLDNLPEGVLITEGRDLRLSVVNRAARQLLGPLPPVGFGLGEWLGNGRFRDADGSDYTAETHPLARAAAGERILAQEMTARRDDGSEIALLANFAPVRDWQQQVVAAVAVVQDISWRRELDQERDDFLAVAAHELRSPLTAIRGQLQLTQRLSGDLPETLRQRLDMVIEQVDRMTEMATRLLDVSRMGFGHLPLECADVDLGEILRTVAERMAPRMQSHELVVDLPDEPLIGWWDRARLDEVIVNLLDNAVRYSPNGGRISVLLRGEGNVALLRVSDQGIGIDHEMIPRLFQRYVRAAPSADRIPGVGLGLYICRTIVEAHGGRIAVESHPGQGATFSVWLPRGTRGPASTT